MYMPLSIFSISKEYDLFMNSQPDAAKVAIQLMLQEEFDHPITSHLALFSCYSYLKKPQPEPWDPQPKVKPEEPAEEVKVRVDYLREPFFDDHFDLTNPNHLIGKTLVGFGKYLSRKSSDSTASTSILLGWTLFEKYEKIIETLDNILVSESKSPVFSEELKLCRKQVEESKSLPDGFLENFNNRVSQLEAQGLIVGGSIQDGLTQAIKDGVNKHANEDIERQRDQYKKWESLREEELKKQTEAIERRKRLAILEARKQELKEKEERLHFFDNLDEWELRSEEKIMQREARERELQSRSKKISAKVQRQAEEDAYYPPEITSNRRQ